MTTTGNEQAGLLKVVSYESGPLDEEDPNGNRLIRYSSHDENGPRPGPMQAMEPARVGHGHPPATRRVVIELLVDEVSDHRLHDFIHRICTK
jgi:hypothetical protein